MGSPPPAPKRASFAGVMIGEGAPHLGGRPECQGSTLKLNGACAVCVTFDLLRQSVDLARQRKPRPPPEALRLLKEAKEARDAKDYPKSFFLSQQSLAMIKGASGTEAPQQTKEKGFGRR